MTPCIAGNASVMADDCCEFASFMELCISQLITYCNNFLYYGDIQNVEISNVLMNNSCCGSASLCSAAVYAAIPGRPSGTAAAFCSLWSCMKFLRKPGRQEAAFPV